MKTNEMKKVTIYTSGGFGITKTEASLVEIGHKDYAQYNNALYVAFIPKRKRTAYVVRATYAPYIVVIEGHNHPDPESGLAKVTSNEEVTVTRSRYTSFDERYKTDFDEKISEYIATQKVLVDVRHTVRTEIVNA